MSSKLDPAQIIKAAFDEASESLKTSLVAASIEISAISGDSIRAVNGAEPKLDWDYVGIVYSGAGAVATKTYRIGGAEGTIVGTSVETYQDATRVQLNSILRT